MRASLFVLLPAVALGLAGLFPAQAGADPYGYYGGRYYPGPGVRSSYPVSPSAFPARPFNYAGPVYPMFPGSPAPYVNYYAYSPPVNSYYYPAAVNSYNYSAQGGYYYNQPYTTYLYAGSTYP